MSATAKLSSGFKIPLIGLGVYMTPPEVTTKTVYDALKLGYKHVDSAQGYHNEKEVVGAISQFLKDTPDIKREDLFYTTKLNVWENVGYKAVSDAIRESIDIAKPIGYIDLFLIHSPKGSAENRLGSYKALQEAVDSGAVKSIGVSNYGIHHLEELFNWPDLKYKPVVNQIELHPWMSRDAIVDYCLKNDVLLEAWGPIARAQKMDDPQLLQLAKKYNKTPSQILIRWSLDKGFITLPKSVHHERLVENLDVNSFKLSDEDVKNFTLGDVYFTSNPPFDPASWSLDN